MTHPVHFFHIRVPVSETLYPDQDITDGNWVEIGNLTNNTNLYTFVDDNVTPDTEGITTESPGGGRFLTVCGSPGDQQTCVLGLPDFTTPPSGSETFTLQIRARLVEQITPGDGHSAEVELELLQGASTVVNSTNPTHSLTTSFATYDEILTLGEVNSLLADTSDMRLRILARGCVAGSGDEADVEVTMVRLDVVA